jgi:alginate O-acetyltransferase complex protein AlgI
VAWGVLHGLALIVERAGLLKLVERIPAPLQRIYTLALVVAGWILFRCDSFAQAAGYFRALASFNGWTGFHAAELDPVISTEGWMAIVGGVLAATPLLRWLASRMLAKQTDGVWVVRPAGTMVLMSLLLLSAMKLASGSFNPFIYYRF